MYFSLNSDMLACSLAHTCMSYFYPRCCVSQLLLTWSFSLKECLPTLLKINKQFSVGFIISMQSVWRRSISPSCELKKIAINSLPAGDTFKKSIKIKGKIEFPAWEGQMMEHSEFPRLLVCLGHLPSKLRFMSICHRLWSRHSLTTAITRLQVVLSFGKLSIVIGNGQMTFRTSLQI